MIYDVLVVRYTYTIYIFRFRITNCMSAAYVANHKHDGPVFHAKNVVKYAQTFSIYYAKNIYFNFY